VFDFLLLISGTVIGGAICHHRRGRLKNHRR